MEKKEEEKGKKYEDKTFQDTQDNAADGKGPKSRKDKKEKKSSEKIKDDLLNAKEADKERSNESDQYRRDNA